MFVVVQHTITNPDAFFGLVSKSPKRLRESGRSSSSRVRAEIGQSVFGKPVRQTP